MRPAGSMMRGAALAVVMALVGHGVFADGFRNPPEGAAVLGRGGVRLATSEGGLAVIHNPANLLDENSAVSVGVLVGHGEKDYRSARGASEHTRGPWHVFPSVSATWKPDDARWALGVAVHSPYGQANEWPERGIQTLRGQPYYAAVNTLNVTPAAAFRVMPALTLGAGVDVLRAEMELRQATPWPVAPDQWSRLELEGDGYGVGAHAGATWDITPRQRLAVVYRTGITVDCEGDFRIQNPVPVPPPLGAKGEFETTVRFPSVAAVGYRVKPNDAFRVEVNVEWVEHSRYENTPVDIGSNNPLLHPQDLRMGVLNPAPLTVPQTWEDTWTFGVGADWEWAPGWTLRGGWSYLPSPVPSETLSGSNAESDQHVVAVGLGFRRGGHAADVAGAQGFASDRRDPDGGRYEFTSLLLAAAYRLVF